MKITITIDTENDAFQPEPWDELYRIMEHLGELFELGEPFDGQAVMDRNGNTCGRILIED